MADSSPAVDALISPTDALIYWTSIPPTPAGMLGGFPHVSTTDLRSSSLFLTKLLRRNGRTSAPAFLRAADCGAGIGRVTAGLLARFAAVVDVVEPVAKFTDALRAHPGAAAGKVGEVVNLGLEAWRPERAAYDLIWHQWCVGQLTDRQLVEHLRRCGAALREGGWVVVKENLSTDAEGRDVFDGTDSSVTRSDDKFRELFERAGLEVVGTELQRGFPKELFPVRTYALRPMAEEEEEEER